MHALFSIFGSFVKVIVEVRSTNRDISRISTNAFSVLMAAQRSLLDLERSGLPQTITERTQDRLYSAPLRPGSLWNVQYVLTPSMPYISASVHPMNFYYAPTESSMQFILIFYCTNILLLTFREMPRSVHSWVCPMAYLKNWQK